jgi:hypothetical protein
MPSPYIKKNESNLFQHRIIRYLEDFISQARAARGSGERSDGGGLSNMSAVGKVSVEAERERQTMIMGRSFYSSLGCEFSLKVQPGMESEERRKRKATRSICGREMFCQGEGEEKMKI